MPIDMMRRLLLRMQFERKAPRCYLDKRLGERVHVYVGAARVCACGDSATLRPARRIASWRDMRGKDWKAYLNGESENDKEQP